MVLDPTEVKHARALERLRADKVAWLTTVRWDGQPQSSPLWFTWDGKVVAVLSMPTSAKLANIRANPHVSVNLDSDGRGLGDDVVTLEGRAELFDAGGLEDGYRAKYGEEIRALGSDAEGFARAYSMGIRITPTRARVC